MKSIFTFLFSATLITSFRSAAEELGVVVLRGKASNASLQHLVIDAEFQPFSIYNIIALEFDNGLTPPDGIPYRIGLQGTKSRPEGFGVGGVEARMAKINEAIQFQNDKTNWVDIEINFAERDAAKKLYDRIKSEKFLITIDTSDLVLVKKIDPKIERTSNLS